MKTFLINYFRLKNLGLEFIHVTNSTICYPEHNHTTTFTINLVLNGEITLNKQREKYDYKKDACFIIFPYEVHSITTKSTYDMISLCINKTFLKKQTIKQACTIIKNNAIQMFADKISSENSQKMLLMFEQMYKKRDEQTQKQDIYTNLTKLYSDKPEKVFHLDQTAKLVHTSKYHLIRKFKKTVGLTPHKFHLHRRIRMAQNLLEAKTPLLDIALATGFYDQSHFIRHFKSFMGLTPTEYQKSVKTNITLGKI